MHCCCACAEKRPSKTRPKEQTRRKVQGQETMTNFAGVLEAERLLCNRTRVLESSTTKSSTHGRARGRAGEAVYVDERERGAESGRDLVAMCCMGGKHIVMRAGSRVTRTSQGSAGTRTLTRRLLAAGYTESFFTRMELCVFVSFLLGCEA